MHILLPIVTIVGLIVFGAALNQLLLSRHRKDSTRPSPVIPVRVPDLSDHQREMLQIYLKEWQVIIDTQMHFNDLILRFRAITLTAFVTLIGAAVAATKLGLILEHSLDMLFVLIFSLWFTSFIIDFRYYHRLLLGSVKQASKYDDSDFFKSYGLFGMTSTISEQVRPWTSKWLIIVYYAVPTIAWAFTYIRLKFG